MDRLLRADPRQLVGSAAACQLELLLAQLRACGEAGAELSAWRKAEAAKRAAAPMSWLCALGADSGDLARHCFAFGDAQLLARARMLSVEWRRLAEVDALWHPLLLERWHGTAALVDAGVVRGQLVSFYFRRLWMERNRIYPLALSPAPTDAYSVLVELSCGQRVLVSGLFDVFATPDGTGLEVRLPEGRDTVLQLGDIDNVRLSLTVVRRGDSKLMRVCREAGLVEDLAPGERYAAVDMGGDASDCLIHPALWTAIACPICHYVGLDRMSWSGDSIERFETIFVGLWDPREMIGNDGAARVLTVWREIGEWV